MRERYGETKPCYTLYRSEQIRKGCHPSKGRLVYNSIFDTTENCRILKWKSTFAAGLPLDRKYKRRRILPSMSPTRTGFRCRASRSLRGDNPLRVDGILRWSSASSASPTIIKSRWYRSYEFNLKTFQRRMILGNRLTISRIGAITATRTSGPPWSILIWQVHIKTEILEPWPTTFLLTIPP
jgi:hypothetical protein